VLIHVSDAPDMDVAGGEGVSVTALKKMVFGMETTVKVRMNVKKMSTVEKEVSASTLEISHHLTNNATAHKGTLGQLLNH